MSIADAGRHIRHVFVRDLELAARIGVYASEHGRTQRIRVNVDLGAVESGEDGVDDLDRVVDYSVIVERVRALVAAGHVRLVETLAERIAAACLEDPRILSARIRVEKLDIYPDASSVGVEIERLRAATCPPPAIES